MNENERKLSYRDVLNMSRGNSYEARQRRMLDKYGSNTSNTKAKDINLIEEKKEAIKISKEKDIENKETQNQVEIKSDIIVEEATADIPEKDINPIKEFEKIFARYLNK